jgi:hypothetical protein
LIEIEQFGVLFPNTNFKLCGNMAAVMERADGKAAGSYLPEERIGPADERAPTPYQARQAARAVNER